MGLSSINPLKTFEGELTAYVEETLKAPMECIRDSRDIVPRELGRIVKEIYEICDKWEEDVDVCFSRSEGFKIYINKQL